MVLPLFVVLLLFILEGGRLMATYISVSNAARAGARTAALANKTNAQIRQVVLDSLLPIAGPGIVNTGTTNATSDIDITCRSYSLSTGSYGSSFSECTHDGSSGTLRRYSGYEVRVQVTFTYEANPLIGGPLGLFNPGWKTFTLVGEARAFVE